MTEKSDQFERLAYELMDEEGSDIVAMVAIRVPHDENLNPWAEVYGKAPKQFVATVLGMTADSLTDQAASQQ